MINKMLLSSVELDLVLVPQNASQISNAIAIGHVTKTEQLNSLSVKDISKIKQLNNSLLVSQNAKSKQLNLSFITGAPNSIAQTNKSQIINK
jgi:hypothetical protein